MERIIKYEFVVIPNDGSPTMSWGYRKKKKSAHRRLKELRRHFEDRKHARCTVECYKVVSVETRHPVNFEEDSDGRHDIKTIGKGSI